MGKFSNLGISRVAINASSSGDNTLVAAVTNGKIQVEKIVLIPNAAVTIKFKSGSTDITGAMNLAAAGNGYTEDANYNGVHGLEAATGEALILNLSGAVQCGGYLVYRVVKQ